MLLGRTGDVSGTMREEKIPGQASAAVVAPCRAVDVLWLAQPDPEASAFMSSAAEACCTAQTQKGAKE